MNTLHFAGIAVTVFAVTFVTPAAAQNYDFEIQNVGGGPVPVSQANPDYPSRVRSGQEGWVRVNFMITADGKAVNPIIVNSVGGAVFEESVIERVPEWRFEPTGEVLANNTTDVRFEMHDGRDLATSNFLRRYRRIVRHLFNEEYLEARTSVDQTAELGGWNLYESTMLWLMIGRVEGAEGHSMRKLDAYRRALGVSNARSLDGEDLRELLRRLFELEMEHSLYAAADRTLRQLRRETGSKADLEKIAELVAVLEDKLAGDAALAARASLFSPGGGADGQPLWTYVPARRTFSFAALSGNVERFEVRCERDRLEGPVEAGKAWSLPDGANDCRVFVFGEQGASFEFVEHNESESVDVAARASVARSDVLD
jgi:TonB family protein